MDVWSVNFYRDLKGTLEGLNIGFTSYSKGDVAVYLRQTTSPLRFSPLPVNKRIIQYEQVLSNQQSKGLFWVLESESKHVSIWTYGVPFGQRNLELLLVDGGLGV